MVLEDYDERCFTGSVANGTIDGVVFRNFQSATVLLINLKVKFIKVR